MNEKQREALNEALKILDDAGLNVVSEPDILEERKVDGQNLLFIGNTQLSYQDEQELKNQAKAVMQMQFFMLVLNATRNAAIKKLAFTSKDWDGVFMGKAMLFEDTIFRGLMHTLANRETKVEKMSKK